MLANSSFTSVLTSEADMDPRSSKLWSWLDLLLMAEFPLSDVSAISTAEVVDCCWVADCWFQFPASFSFQADSFIDRLVLLSDWGRLKEAGSSMGTSSTFRWHSWLDRHVAASKPDSIRPGTKANRARIEVLNGLTGEWKKRTRFWRRRSLKSRIVLCWNLCSSSLKGRPRQKKR